MELTVKKKAFLEDLPKVVGEAVEEYGTRLRKIVIEEDEKGCYTVFITYDAGENPFNR